MIQFTASIIKKIDSWHISNMTQDISITYNASEMNPIIDLSNAAWVLLIYLTVIAKHFFFK